MASDPNTIYGWYEIISKQMKPLSNPNFKLRSSMIWSNYYAHRPQTTCNSESNYDRYENYTKRLEQ